MNQPYWKVDPNKPFATLIALVGAYCHPEADEDAYNALQRLVKRTDVPDAQRFRVELVDALSDPSRLPNNELFEKAKYSDGSDEKFLQRLWRDLYPDEPLPQTRIRE